MSLSQKTLRIQVNALPDSPLVARYPVPGPRPKGLADTLRHLEEKRLNPLMSRPVACSRSPEIVALRDDLASRYGVNRKDFSLSGDFDAMAPLVAEVSRLCREGVAEIRSADLTIDVVDGSEIEWYWLGPCRTMCGWTTKAGLCDVANVDPYLATNRFRAVVEKHELTGLAFTKTEGGSGDLARWYRMSATRCLGQGIWPDREGGVFAGITRLVPPHSFVIRGGIALYRPVLPESDFAGMAQFFEPKKRFYLHRVYVRRSAAEVLLEEGVLTSDDLHPIEVFDKASAEYEVRDRTSNPLPEEFTTELESRRSDPIEQEPTVEVGATMEEALARLRASRALISEYPPGREVGIDDWDSDLPVLFLDFLDAMDGMGIYPRLELYHSDDEPIYPDDPALPESLVSIGGDGGGDWYAVVEGDTSEQCPVYFFDHEVQECTDYWPTLAEFIMYLLDSAESHRNGDGSS